jgi:hypothetical protein
MSTAQNIGNITTNGLSLYWDAANPRSFISGSTLLYDLTNNNNTGILTNGPVYSGTSAGGIVFDGSNDLVYLPYVLNTSTNFTIEVVAKCNNMISDLSPQNRQTIWSFTSGTSQGYQLLDLEIWNDGITSFNGNNNLFTTTLTGNFSPLGTNNISVYTLSKLGTNQTWYINSTVRASVTQTYTGTSQYFKLGSRGSGATGTGQQWNGIIYSVKIYNRNLTSTEILKNYNSIRARFNLP